MPYDPSLPADHSPLVSAEMRAQLTGLKDLIDAVPAGPQGMPGDVTSAELDAAIAAALSAAASNSSANSNSVDTLFSPFTHDPPTVGDMETLRAKINQLITALRR